jgi:hypothetical protein
LLKRLTCCSVHGGRSLARPVVVPRDGSLLAVLVSIRAVVVMNAAAIATITATAKSRTAVRSLFRSLLMIDLLRRYGDTDVPSAVPNMNGLF